MIIDYALEKLFTMSVDIEDLGNCCLRCAGGDSGGLEYYYFVKSEAGFMSVLKYGPIFGGLPEVLPDNFGLDYNRSKFNQGKLEKDIKAFVNDPKKNIKEVICITEYEAEQDFPQITNIFHREV